MAQSNTVTVPRITAASAADYLRDYARELEQAGAEGEYTQEIADIVTVLDSALGDDTLSCSHEKDG
ncbi:hypothetical protein NDI56_11605 [Haloarcula sp. S1CR25-12]|uniref:Uncharacterized protein n=1 Tax=Haloarcula saliterrae TaxID=2950534 RepID=A0ABU2FCQ1_9EURY|nr:hypothetical protein [Haloarcula sp. S1CR25-12]MDS0260040.1 hypothetical protein [Haloarcula sp. S1CR25-12]